MTDADKQKLKQLIEGFHEALNEELPDVRTCTLAIIEEEDGFNIVLSKRSDIMGMQLMSTELHSHATREFMAQFEALEALRKSLGSEGLAQAVNAAAKGKLPSAPKKDSKMDFVGRVLQVSEWDEDDDGDPMIRVPTVGDYNTADALEHALDKLFLDALKKDGNDIKDPDLLAAMPAAVLTLWDKELAKAKWLKHFQELLEQRTAAVAAAAA
jgi:hypothetical protein